MAKMMNARPEREGEAYFWDKVRDNLNNDIICYNHREVMGKEFDFCLLVKEIGLILIEVKGWNKVHVLNVESSDKIWLKDEKSSNGKKECGSPREQCRTYRFNLLETFKNRYSKNPAIYSMVCYPFLSQFDYNSLGLNIVSEPQVTFFNEDLVNKANFNRKLVEMIRTVDLRNFDKMNNDLYDICRKHFESNYQPEKKNLLSGSSYSELRTIKHKPSLSEIGDILQSYVNGTKQIIFIEKCEEINTIALQLSDKLNALNIVANGGNFSFSETPDNHIDVKNNRLSIFNFEVYGVDSGLIDEEFVVENGNLNDDQIIFLELMKDKVSFNKQQYEVEHSEVNRDIYVKAGAGTGKTYTMVSRIAYLCHPSSGAEVYSPHEEIAMLTFTAKAAVNMKVRLKSLFMNYYLLTRSVSYLELIANIEKMQISTIHSFANRIIQNTSLPLGIGTNFTTVNGVYDKTVIFEKHFNKFLAEKNAVDPYFFDKIPIPVYSLRKKLLEIPKKLYDRGYDIKKATIDIFGKPIDEMPYINEIIENVLISTEIEYSQLLFDNNSINLGEYMIYLNKCINDRSFNKNLFKFKYFFIDEFQDTDDAQISSFLSMQEKLEFSFFIVGDLKQSIYRFRGATMGAFERMGCEENNWKFFTLNINYRSDKRLLQKYDKMFEKLGELNLIPFKCGEDNLTGVKENIAYSDNELIESYDYNRSAYKKDEFYKDLFEKVNIEINKIKTISDKKILSQQEKTIAILTRTNYEIGEILKNAKKYEVDVESDSSGDLYRLPPAIDLCKLTAALCNPYNNVYLFDLIHSNYIKAEFSLIHSLKQMSEEEKKSKMIAFLDEFFKHKLNKTWNQLIYDVQNKPVLMMLKIIYDKLQPWIGYSVDSEKQEFYRTNYELVFEELSNDNKKSYITLESINENLHIFILTGTEKKSRVLDNDSNKVKVICTTVHKSKGLEYGTVILPFTSKDISEVSKNSVDAVVIDDKIGYCIIEKGKQYSNENYSINTEKHEQAMEESRILYVAMTRAINNFIYCRNIDVGNESWGVMLEELK